MATTILAGYTQNHGYCAHPGGNSIFSFSGGTICQTFEFESEADVVVKVPMATKIRFALVTNHETGAVIARSITSVVQNGQTYQEVAFNAAAVVDVFIVYEL